MITIITVCFNAANELEKTIQSVLQQENCQLEYIIKDGGSTDSTKNVVEKYLPQLRQLAGFTFVSEKDTGLYEAMNIATQMASGEYVLFLNSGDCLYDKNVIACAESKNLDADIVYGDMMQVSGLRRNLCKATKEDVENFNCMMDFCHQAAFIKTDVMKSLKYDTSYPICADFEFFQRAYANGATFKHIDETIVLFLVGGISYQHAFDLLDETYDIQFKYGMISKNKWFVIKQMNKIKRRSRKLLPKQCYDKLKKWKKHQREKKWSVAEQG